MWIRWFAGLLVVAGPSSLAVWWALRGAPRLARGTVAGLAGWLVVPAFAPWLEAAGLDWSAAPAAGLGGLLCVAAWRTVGRGSAGADLPRPGSGAWRWPLATSLVLVLLLGIGLRAFVVPPHLHDATNHAFLVQRIAETASVDPDVVFGPPWGGREVPYLAGWHAVAGPVAALTGLPPDVAAWFSALTAIVALPWSWFLLWRMWGFADREAGLATLFLVTHPGQPLGILGWGGFSTLVAWPLTTVVVATLLALWRRPGFGTAVLAAAAWFALSRVQAAAAIWSLVLALPAVVANPATAGVARRLAAFAGFLAALAVLTAPSWGAAGTYASLAMNPPEGTGSWGRGLDAFHRGLGSWAPLRIPVTLGLVLGLRWPRTRVVAGLALVVAVVTIALDAHSDPFTRWLASPFYQEPSRLRSLQLFLLPPLGAAGLVWLADRWKPLRRPAVATLGLLLLFLPAAIDTGRRLPRTRDAARFTAEELHLARRLAERLDAGTWIANTAGDGSAWVQYRTHLRLTSPTGWALRPPTGPDLRAAAAGLGQAPWPATTLALRDLGVEMVWASDTWLDHPPAFTRADLEADPRFERLDTGGPAAVFRILWDEQE